MDRQRFPLLGEIRDFMIEFAEGGTQEWGTNGMWTTAPANPTVDLQVKPPWGFDSAANRSCEKDSCPANPCGSAEACPHKPRADYAYDDPGYNWRALRVISSTDDFLFAQWAPHYNFGVGPPAPPPGPAAPPRARTRRTGSGRACRSRACSRARAAP